MISVKKIKNKKYILGMYIAALAIAFIISFGIHGKGLEYFLYWRSLELSQESVLDLEQIVSSDMSGYIVDENGEFQVENNDPQILCNIDDQRVVKIKLLFAEKLDKDIHIQIYYATQKEPNFSEENSKVIIPSEATDAIEVEINEKNVTALRFDIGGEPGQTFYLDKIIFNEQVGWTFNEAVFGRIPWKTVILWTQIYFILLGFILLHFIVDKNRIYDFIFKKRWIVAGLLLLFLMINKLHGDSLATYDLLIQPNLGSEYVDPVFGEIRTIRSDEYVVDTPSELASGYGETPYGKYNYIQRGTETLNAVNGINLSYSTLGKAPYYFSYLVLEKEYAFSFCWYAPIILAFMLSFELCLIIAKRNRLTALVGACLITFSSFYLWWNFPSFLIGAQGAIVCAYYFIVRKKLYQKALLALGTAICFAQYVLSLYPAWIVPVGYVALMFIIWIVVDNWSTIKQFKWKEYCLIIIALGFAGSLILSYLSTNREYVEAITNTVYPGSRIETGGFSIKRIFSYFDSYLYAFKDIENPSEASGFLCFFPIPLAAGLYQCIKSKKKDWLTILLIGITGVFLIYCTTGIPEIIAKCTLLGYCTPNRLIPIIGLVQVYMLVRWLGLEETERHTIPTKAAWGFSILTVAAGIYYTITVHKDYMNIFLLCLTTICIIVIGKCIMGLKTRNVKGYLEKCLILFACITGLAIRPVSIGLDSIYSKPVAQKIQEICNEQETTKWIVCSDNFITQGFTVACGAPTINSVNSYPNMEFWHTLDPEGKYEEVYNRYAHINVDIVDDETSIELLYEDCIQLNISSEDLQKTGCTHIFSLGELEDIYDELDFVELYAEDGSFIYEVRYNDAVS